MNLDRIGKYRVVARIGQGAMGEVYKAQDPLLNRYVALKTISPAFATDPEFRQRFQREAQSAAGLNHPNIVTIFDFGNDDSGLTYMVMELLEGRDLRETIRARALGSLPQRLDLVAQLCEGLAFAHARGVVHRDLKPGNIHVQPTGQVKILDFGLARLSSSDMTKTGTVLGTPHYMSPEQVRGEKADARSDVFSLGAVFYEVLTLRRPFEGASVPDVLQHIAVRDPAPLRSRAPDTPAAVVEIVERALAKAPSARFADAGEMARALVRARDTLAGETLSLPARSSEPATIIQTPAETLLTPAVAAGAPRTDGATALDSRPASGLRRREMSGTARPDPTVAGEWTEVRAAPSHRTTAVAVGAAALVVATAVGGWLWLRSRPAPSSAASSSQEQSVLTELLLSGKVELARADLDNRDYAQAADHAREALAIDATSAEARAVVERAEGALRELEAAAAAARTAFAKGDTAAASEALGRALSLDPRHPVVRELSSDLNRYARRQADEARTRAAAARAAVGDERAATGPSAVRARRLGAEADALFREERFAEAAQKYLESGDGFEALRREVEAARVAAASPSPSARPAPTAVPTPGVASAVLPPPASPTASPATPAPAPTVAAVPTPTPSLPVPSLPSLPAPDASETAVRRAIADFGRAFESQDVELYRSLMPALSSEDESKIRESFKTVKYDRVGIEIQSLEVSGGEATAQVLRQDTINGRAAKPRRQVFRLARAGSAWRIVSMSTLKE
jgi:serine/threonine-protein kinase